MPLRTLIALPVTFQSCSLVSSRNGTRGSQTGKRRCYHLCDRLRQVWCKVACCAKEAEEERNRVSSRRPEEGARNGLYSALEKTQIGKGRGKVSSFPTLPHTLARMNNFRAQTAMETVTRILEDVKEYIVNDPDNTNEHIEAGDHIQLLKAIVIFSENEELCENACEAL